MFDDTVLTIRGHKNKRLIDLGGINSDGEEHSTTLDVVTGEIFGLVIDCGEWQI
jgi:hypothetical protein